MSPAARTAKKRIGRAARRALIEAAAAELFAARGYRGASVDEIAGRAGVTPPVVYDHFESKLDLYRQLLERHFAELRTVWRENFTGEAPLRDRVARSFDAWFVYVGEHPFAGRVLFRDAGGDPEAAKVRAAVAASSREAILPLFAAEPGAAGLAGSVGGEGLEMAWVVLRGVLQGLAVWWSDNPGVPRERVVSTAMNALWLGFERVQGGEAWEPAQLDQPG